MKTIKTLLLAATLLFPISALAKTINVEFLKGELTPATAARLADLSCRNVDKIVHLDLSLDWPEGQTTIDQGRLVFWDVDGPDGGGAGNQFDVPRDSYQYQHGSYMVKGYFIVRSSGTYQGVTSDTFERVDDAKVILNPNVHEVPAKSGCVVH